MVEIAIASLPHIQATLNYVAATGEKLVSYAYEPPAGIPLSTVQVEGHATTIHDLRPKASEFALFAEEIVRNPMHNGRTYRLDAGLMLPVG